MIWNRYSSLGFLELRPFLFYQHLSRLSTKPLSRSLFFPFWLNGDIATKKQMDGWQVIYTDQEELLNVHFPLHCIVLA